MSSARIRYDLQPPPWISSKVAAAAISRVKNPVRAAPSQFTDPVCLAEHGGVLGHYSRDGGNGGSESDGSGSDGNRDGGSGGGGSGSSCGSDGRGAFWGQTAAVPIVTDDVRILGGQDATLPAGVLHVDGGSGVDPATYRFYDFTLPAEAPSILAIAGGSALPRAYACVDGMGPGWVPCARFVAAAAGTEIRYIHVAAAAYVAVAQALTTEGWLVSAPVRPGTPHPLHTVQATTLRWVTDCEARNALSKFADSAPGAASAASLTDAVYDKEMNVPRSMLSWGAVGAQLAREHKIDADTCEPLASYIRGVLRVQNSRRRQGGEGLAAADTAPLLAYNTPQRMSREQTAHAVALYYWAAIHSDAATRPLPAAVARQSLELYLRFGFVLLRKRAYQFRGNGSSGSSARTNTKRRRRVESSSDEDDEEEDD
jgi:hypothetical protein